MKEYVLQRNISIPHLLEAFGVSLASFLDHKFLLVGLWIPSAQNYGMCEHKHSNIFSR